MIEVRYFAWLRERIGTGSEQVETGAVIIRDLVAELAARGGGHALAFADIRAVRVALDQDLADLDTPIAGAREIAFFPPMTGG